MSRLLPVSAFVVLFLFLSIAISPTTASNFMASCKHCQMHNGLASDPRGHLLRCRCKHVHPTRYHFTRLHLNEHIGLGKDGKIFWGGKGYRGDGSGTFLCGDSSELRKEDGTVPGKMIIKVNCLSEDKKLVESELDLNEHISNVKGYLKVDPAVAEAAGAPSASSALSVSASVILALSVSAFVNLWLGW